MNELEKALADILLNLVGECNAKGGVVYGEELRELCFRYAHRIIEKGWRPVDKVYEQIMALFGYADPQGMVEAEVAAIIGKQLWEILNSE